MITGFEDQTYELTKFERQVIFPLIEASWRSRSINELITMKEMVQKTNQHCIEKHIYHPNRVDKNKQPIIFKITGVRMRKIIHRIRIEGKITNLIANNRGYFLSNDSEQIKQFIHSCRERANSFIEVADAMVHYLREKDINRTIPVYTQLIINDTTYCVLQSPAAIQRALQSSMDGEIELTNLDSKLQKIKITSRDKINLLVINNKK